MNKNTAIHIVILVVTLIAGSILGSFLNKQNHQMLPEKSAMRNLPLAGMHKFAADVEWMLFVNYMGSISEVNQDNIAEVNDRIERLIQLDPNLEKLYRDGVSFMAFAAPEKTLEIFRKACENKVLAQSSSIPFYTGVIMIQNIKNPDYEEAAKYFKMAAGRNSGAEDIPAICALSHYYTCKAKALAASQKISQRLALAEVLYKALETEAGTDNGDLRKRLMTALRDVRSADEDYTPTKQAIDRARQISGKVFADSHLCDDCMSSINAGDKFCGGCGKQVKEVWGACSKCGNVVGGSYCGQCGTKAK